MCKRLNFIRKQKKGASLIIVIMLLTLLMVLTMGLAAVTSFGVNSSVIQRNYSQAYYAAKSINMSICDAITSEAGLPMVNGWEQEFEEALDEALTDEAQHEKNEEGNIIKITVPSGKLKYSNGSTGNTYYEIDDTGIEAKNKIALEYERKDDLNYKVKNIIVETTAKYDSQVYTIKAQLTNVGYSGGGTGSSIVYSYYIIGSTGDMKFSGSKNVDGDIVSNHSIEINSISVKGSITAGEDISVKGDSCTVEGGNMISASNITIGAGGAKIKKGTSSSKGNVAAWGDVTISGAGAEIDGDVVANGDVNISGSGAIIGGDIISGGDVIITGGSSSVKGNIYSAGNVTISGTSGKTYNMIKANGDVNLSGYTAGNIVAGGNVYIRGTTVETNVVAVGNVEGAGWASTVKGYIQCGGIIKDTINCQNKQLGVQVDFTPINFTDITGELRKYGIDSSGNIEGTADVVWSFDPGYEATLDKTKNLEQCIAEGEFDTTGGDLYFETYEDIYIDKDVTVKGDNRVFILMKGIDKKLTFHSDNKSGGIEFGNAKQLFIISDNPNHIIISGNRNVINAQIYMPRSTFEYKYGNDVEINGVIIIEGTVGGNKWYYKVKFKIINADYSYTVLEKKVGEGSSEASAGEWKVERYYK